MNSGLACAHSTSPLGSASVRLRQELLVLHRRSVDSVVKKVRPAGQRFLHQRLGENSAVGSGDGSSSSSPTTSRGSLLLGTTVASILALGMATRRRPVPSLLRVKRPSVLIIGRRGESENGSCVGPDAEVADEEESDSQEFENEMLSEMMRSALEQENYLLVGSHSAVKICAWTRNQLRGRGGCYKHTFYGIASHQCMEVTPSLACANKCTFCWRHHTNPVAKEWEWKQDPPGFIVEGAIKEHLKMIKSMEGIRDGRKDRFEEARNVKHCALSLVGEPIMYPGINQLVEDLHQRGISSFLVTNGQFPEAIRSLGNVTQLYISVDAPTKDELKAIDRPLHSDFWERFIASLEALREKRHRTVYRLTMIRGMNMQGIVDYARLVTIGQPDFIEMKAMVTLGGGGEEKLGDLVTLTREEHMPLHKEVLEFALALRDALRKEFEAGNLLDEYEIASEHMHSRTVLLARKRFLVDGQWHTWVNYEKYNELVRRGPGPIDALDYAAPTPSWAFSGAEEAGFDPEETRWFHPWTVHRFKKGLIQKGPLDELRGIETAP
ncbi:unnamed protein product [Polarella glacialis]|uniref:Radical SAM core domain-containing protein n=1 Tax=Polarella glacialis TaxID=89957 RepID=A0A813GJ49_POLGL|nr:unnamed protein product [Polarella glacialis]